jgi:integrase
MRSLITINAELKDHVNKQGLRQVYIRITQNKKHKRIRVENVEIKKAEWSGKHGFWINSKNKNCEKLNLTIQERLTEYKNQYLDLKKEMPVVSKEEIFKAVVKDNVSKNFMEYWDLKTSLKAMPEYNQRKGYVTERTKIIDFAGKEKIDFSEINQEWLENFEAYLFKTGLASGTVHAALKRIRAIWNKAIDHDKIIDKSLYPFGKGGYKLPHIEQKMIERLFVDEVKEIKKLEYPSDQLIYYAQKSFLLSFNCAGIRAEDLLTLKWTDIKNERLVYNMKKGVTKGKLRSIEITPKLKMLLDSIKSGQVESNFYILPFLKEGTEELSNEDYKKEINRKTSLVNKYLRKIAEDACLDKTITSHIARHSWAGYAYEETKDIRFVQQNLEHTYSKTTESYIGRLGFSQNDEKLRAIEL